MMGILWGFSELDEVEGRLPSNIMGSLGSLGIEWGYKIRPPKDDHEKRSSKSVFSQEELGEDWEGEVHDVYEDIETECGLCQFSIDDIMANLLQFREKLEVKEITTGKIIGHFTIDVDFMGEDNADFQVHLSGRAVVGETECGTSVTTSVNRKLMTIEEKLHEFAKRKGNTKELNLYIAQDVNNDDGHYLHIACEQRVNTYRDKRTQEVPYEMVKDLVSEGASVLLMRLMALTGYEGTVDLMGVLTNAALYANKFTCTGPSVRWQDGEKQEIFTIQREGKDASGNTLTLQSILTTTGELLEHVWINGPFCLVVSPLIERIGPVVQERKIPLYKHWEDDMQAVSLYLDYKTRRLAYHHTYFEDHPEIEALIADFVQAVLLVKPDDVISFTIDHFKEFDGRLGNKFQQEYPIMSDVNTVLATMHSHLASAEENTESTTNPHTYILDILENL